ncbi:MAG: hypothetical protein CNF01_08925 [Halieaceae bacterium MED-G27]|nr:hypothetical protein [Halieaceae bacterium]OUT64652.1 MAG: hypothetical protein CBB81_08830 [Cellvibrionales bacterium TMED21]PDH33711.1 MAG: hypothetical protein CNF01_08925 [Halieaceae bacterium MED-G27]
MTELDGNAYSTIVRSAVSSLTTTIKIIRSRVPLRLIYARLVKPLALTQLEILSYSLVERVLRNLARKKKAPHGAFSNYLIS